MYTLCTYLSKSSAVPVSSKGRYYLDPKLFVTQEAKFDPTMTEGRVSEAEFQGLRQKMIQAAGSDLKTVNILNKILPITLTIFVIGLILKFVILAESNAIPAQLYLVYYLGIFLPNIIVICTLKSKTAKAHHAIQTLLNNENTTTYASRGIAWSVAPGLNFVLATITNTGIYSPPQAFVGQSPQDQYGVPQNYGQPPTYPTLDAQPQNYGQPGQIPNYSQQQYPISQDPYAQNQYYQQA